VLHSPLVFAYSTSDETGSPDVIGMPDVKQLRKSAPIRPLPKLADINSAVNRIVACATRLNQLRARALVLQEPQGT
jgi:predicted pyridoxine 5'-phosphate oxidase superfamily flavin-nucleotide-binding protein